MNAAVTGSHCSARGGSLADAVSPFVEPTAVRRPCGAGRPIEIDMPLRTRAAGMRRPRRLELGPTAHTDGQTELLAMVAHELRNPLTPIRMAASMLERAGSDRAMLDYLRGVIERQVDHMSRLVEDLLDVSRVATGKLTIERRKADLTGIVDAAVQACRPAMEGRGQRLGIDLPAQVPALHGDTVRLTQVLSNLLENASKFTPEGGDIGLSVAVTARSVVITVTDSGIGIASEALFDLFEPFVQGPRAVGERRGGLGIGLSVVREIVQAHNGTVTVRSAGRGLGSQFVVTLPVDRVGTRAANDACLAGMAAT